MGCPQSKSKSKNQAVDENGSGHLNKVRNDGVSPTNDHNPKTTTYARKDVDDVDTKGREDPDQNIAPVVEAEQETKDNKENAEKEELHSEQIPQLQSIENAQNGFVSVYQADDDDDNVAEFDRLKESDNTDGKTVDVTDINIGQGVSEIEVAHQTVTLDGEDDSGHVVDETVHKSEWSEVENVKEEKFNAGVDDKGGSIEHKHSLKNQPNIRYQNKETMEYGLPKDVPKPAPPKKKKSDIIQATTFTVADRIVDQAPDAASQSVSKLSRYLSGELKKGDITEEVRDPAEGKNIPLPKPSTSKKKDIVKDTGRFKTTDENAKNTPESVLLSVQKLADHLCSGATSDLEKVRAFYYWICHNISYMYDADSVPDRLRYDAVSTLRQGKGSFVNLMAALCNEAKIPVVTIPGCSKGLRHQPDKVFVVGESNHSWNAVYLNGEWRFVDCTWGSGYLGTNGKFHPHFDEFWFLTDPEIFIYDHLPVHPSWQLLEEPIDIDEFNHRASLTEKSRELGLRLTSHREPIIYFDKEVTIAFGTDTIPLSNITADLRTDDLKESNKYRCIQRLNGTEFSIRVVPPKAGEYMLTVFGKSKDYLHAKFRKLIEYTLRCESIYDEPVIFPEHFKAWGPEPNYSELGFAESIQKLSVIQCESHEHSISLEQTKAVAITAEFRSVKNLEMELNDYTLITASDKSKSIHLRFPDTGYYKLDVYAEGKLEKYEFAAAFLLYCSVHDKPRLFPKYNAESVAKFKCRLLQPHLRDLPANTEITFRIESGSLKKVMVGIPVESSSGQGMKSCGELKKDGKTFSGTVRTPAKGETLYLAGCSTPPNIFWSRMYEFLTI